jgi:hypothetical protein
MHSGPARRNLPVNSARDQSRASTSAITVGEPARRTAFWFALGRRCHNARNCCLRGVRLTVLSSHGRRQIVLLTGVPYRC